jgi:stearoyl-CoA desaturase (delta-9 desaturase)
MFFRDEPIDPKVVSDLSRSKMLKFQHEHYLFCMLGSNILTSLVVGYFLGDYLGAFLFAWFVRLFVLHHTTWCINSLAHFWGTQFFSKEHSAVDNYLISLLTYGEGYHNYHHTFSQDYRNGIYWYHFDPAKWLIWGLWKLGLAYDLKKVNDYRIAKQMLLEHKNLILNRVKESIYAQKDLLAAKVTEICESLSEKLSQRQSLVDQYRKQKSKEMLHEIRELKKSLKGDWKRWRETVKIASEMPTQ